MESSWKYFKIKGDIMTKGRIGIVIVLFVFILFYAYGSTDAQKSLAEIYKTGKVRFVPEITIDDTRLPEDVYFLGYGDIGVDEQGNVYAADSRARHVKRFDAAGNFLKLIGREGQGPGEFSSPSNLACSDDRFVVWDMRAMRFSIFSLNGKPIKSVNHSFMEKGNPQKMKALPTGEFVVEIEKIHFDPKTPQDFSIVLFSPDMEQRKTIYAHQVWRNIWGIPNAPNIPMPYSPYVHWDITPEGNIVIGFSEKYRIDICNKDGVGIASFSHPYDPVKVTKEDRDMFLKGMTFGRSGPEGAFISEEPPPAVKEHLKFPDYKPAFDGIAVDSDGNILVCPYRIGNKEEYKSFDAFDPDGNFIARVRIESEHSFLSFRNAQIRDGCFWVKESDKDGYQKIVKYRIE